MSGEAEVGPAIIERIAISVVNKKTFGGIHNFSVQVHIFYTAEFGFSEDSSGIQTIIVTATGGPFVSADGVIDIGVNDGEAIFAEVDFAKGVAKAEQAKGEQGGYKDKVEPVWDFYLNDCHFISSFFSHRLHRFHCLSATEGTESTEFSANNACSTRPLLQI